jgi:glutathione reductase (NADPH)
MTCRDPYDAIIIGAGNAGFGAAGVLREAGRTVLMIERNDVGGTCPLRGCVPKKVLVAAAQTLDVIARASEHKITVGKSELDWAALISRERSFVEGVPADLEASLVRRGVDLQRGSAQFVAPNAISVDGEVFEGRHIVIATGSRPKQLPIRGWEHTITSDDILRNPTLPRSLIFIGGGVIALEFSHVFARAGTAVTILEAVPRLLPRFDEDATDELRRASEAVGIKIETGVEITSIESARSGVVVRYRSGGIDKSAEAESVANGAGREPDVEDLDLAAGNVHREGGRIVVDRSMRSVSNRSVYLAGDALWSTPQLSPVATHEGQIIGNAIARGTETEVDYRSIPLCVFSIPTLAMVGLTEKEAREQGLDIDVKVNDLRGWRSARTYAERAAYAKILIDRPTDRIVGAHILGHGCEETINLIAFAMKHGLSAAELRQMVYAYPTFSADLRNML